ncbi:chloride channel protein [Pedobacter insulae]|uniref:H+/Cl-antiporter ClcA n=1 Tax=Pedobacter insulae TaxID=414048 RepID=A0A1I2WHW0_9SPHI|nr:chloride channel protein [Pedobacter insulae]SFH00905.1 H+/Cl-antiporter ClcA [Pedobacter insulae]
MFRKSSRGKIPIAPALADLEAYLEPSGSLVTKRLLLISLQVIMNAIIIGGIAKLLVLLIDLITNLSFYGIVSVEERSPAGHQLGILVIVVPVIGALVVGMMARYGSQAIRGHGIPEAMEQVLTNESKIKPIITLLKPISAAISIGTGGPFGAEGPIISTGGALGSFAGQLMHITPNERKIMLTAGATAGMAAIFGTPMAAVLLAIELLLFEFSPRSIIPVALACVTGTAMHHLLFGSAPVFEMAPLPTPSYQNMIAYTLMGAVIGVIATGVSKSVYLIEDLFEHLPIHWMFWPAIGAIAVGVVGYFAPYTLGVGYSNISALLSGSMTVQMVLGLCLLKFISWAVSLGSGTSGGTLAPLLTIGGATGLGIGMLVMYIYPSSNVNLPTCALIGMAAMFAGASRALLTSIIFAFETTMQPNGLLPLMGACTAAYFVSFLIMKGTIMTEKIQRRGIATPSAYEPDALQGINVGELMHTKIPVVSPQSFIEQVKKSVQHHKDNKLKGFIACDKEGNMLGRISISSLNNPNADKNRVIADILNKQQLYVYPDSRIALAIQLMDRYQTDFIPVVDRTQKNKAIGILTAPMIFAAYSKHKGTDQRYQRAISIKRSGYKLVVYGKQLLGKDNKKEES